MSSKLISGDAMHDILHSVKDYVDYNDIVFKDANRSDVIGDDGELELINLTLIGQSVLEKDIDDIINKYFTIE